jgi:hypothetical protein
MRYSMGGHARTALACGGVGVEFEHKPAGLPISIKTISLTKCKW